MVRATFKYEWSRCEGLLPISCARGTVFIYAEIVSMVTIMSSSRRTLISFGQLLNVFYRESALFCDASLVLFA